MEATRRVASEEASASISGKCALRVSGAPVSSATDAHKRKTRKRQPRPKGEDSRNGKMTPLQWLDLAVARPCSTLGASAPGGIAAKRHEDNGKRTETVYGIDGAEQTQSLQATAKAQQSEPSQRQADERREREGRAHELSRIREKRKAATSGGGTRAAATKSATRQQQRRATAKAEPQQLLDSEVTAGATEYKGQARGKLLHTSWQREGLQEPRAARAPGEPTAQGKGAPRGETDTHTMAGRGKGPRGPRVRPRHDAESMRASGGCPSHATSQAHTGCADGQAPSQRERMRGTESETHETSRATRPAQETMPQIRKVEWHVSHRAWNKLMHALHGNTVTGPRCPAGHEGKIYSKGSGGPGRRQYECRTCGGWFSQKVPHTVPPGAGRDARWMRGKTPEEMANGGKEAQSRAKITGPNIAAGAICPAGHVGCATGGTTHGSVAKQRLRFECVRCQKPYSQKNPTKLAEGEDAEAAWIRPRGGAAAAPSESTIHEDRGGGEETDRHEEPDTTPATIPARSPGMGCEGDTTVCYGNAQGLSEERAWRAYLHLAARSSLHGILETMWDSARAEKYATAIRQRGEGRLYTACGRHTTRGCGSALYIRSDVPKGVDERVIYQREDGKAMAVHLTWQGMAMVVVLTHAPHKESEQVAYYESIERALRGVYKTRHEEHQADHTEDGSVPRHRHVLWMGDHNHVMDQRRDVQPPHSTTATPNAARARRQLAAYLRAPQDLYRTLHPEGTSTTRKGRRIDAINVSTALVEGEQRFVKVEHVPPTEFMVVYNHERKRTDLAKISDHSLVRATFRVSNIPKAKKPPAFASEILADKDGRARMAEAVRQTIKAARETHEDAETRQTNLAYAMMETSQAYRKEQTGAAKKRAAAAHHKLTNLTAKLDQATKAIDRKKWQPQVERARVEYQTAVSYRQRAEEQRRRRQDIENDEESTQQVNERLRNSAMRQPCTKIIRTKTGEDGEPAVWEATTNEDIHRAFIEQWRPIMQLEMDEDRSKRAGAAVLERIRARMEKRLSPDESAALEIDAILTKANVEAAIMRIKAHTAPGQDGVPIDPYQTCMQHTEAKEAMLEHLVDLFRKVVRQGEMTANMRESVTTMVHKKNATTDAANYRPIAVTATEYRILATAMAMRLAQVLHKLIGGSQIGFMIERVIDENVDLMMETLRYANDEASDRGGAIVILDNTAAYDHVWRPFLMRTLAAFGLPQGFQHAVATLLRNSVTRLKINGTLGAKIEQTSGVRQGCPLSSMLYLFVMEVMLTTIRDDSRITGMEIPGEDGSDANGERTTIKERSLADDLAVYVTRLEQSLPALQDDLKSFKDMSGQRIKLSKSATVLCGKDADRAKSAVQELWPGMEFRTLSVQVAKYHGIEVCNGEGAEEQWRGKIDELLAIMDKDESVFMPRSIAGRVRLARSRYVSKLAYMFKYQVPERQTADAMLKEIQTRIKQNVMGSINWLQNAVALQRWQDGGFEMPHVQSELEAAWMGSIQQCLHGEARPHKNFVRYQLRRTYGSLGCGTRLLTANYSYEAIVAAPHGAVTEKMRRAFEVYGALPRMQPAQAERTLTGEVAEDTQQRVRSAPRNRQVAYHAEAKKDNWSNGLCPKPAKSGERSPTREEIVRQCVTAYGSAWGITMYADPLRAKIAIDQDRETKTPKLTGKIVAIEMNPESGEWVRLDDAGARERARLTKTQNKHAKELHPIVVIGKEGAVPSISTDRVLAEIDTSAMPYTTHTASTEREQRRKAIPESTRQQLTEWMEDCVAIAPQGPIVSRQSVRAHWGRGEVLRQLLWHNAYYGETTRQGRRSDANSEAEAIRWAEYGVATVHDVLNTAGDDVIEAAEFRRRHPSLDSSVYEQMLSDIPKAWRAVLRKGESDEARARERWWRNGATYWRTWTEAIDEGIMARKVRRYEREPGTRRLRPSGEAQTSQQPPIGTKECAVREVVSHVADAATWTEGTAKGMRRARDTEWAYEVEMGEIETRHEPLHDLTVQTGGLTERQATPMHQLRARHVRMMRAAPRPVVPRAWDATNATEHYAKLYGDKDKGRVTAALQRAIKGSRHPLIPAHVQDVLYKIVVSGFVTHTQGREVLCTRCQRHGVRAYDTLEHRYAEHAPTRQLWEEVIARWNVATYDTLSAADLRVTLLGDRGDNAKAVDETLWRMVHAATIWAIHKTAKTAREHPEHHKEPAVAEMVKEVRRMMQRMTEKAWARRDVYGQQIQEWRAAGWVSGTKWLKAEILARNTEAQATDPRPCSGRETSSDDDGSAEGRRGDESEEQREQSTAQARTDAREDSTSPAAQAAQGNHTRPCSGPRAQEETRQRRQTARDTGMDPHAGEERRTRAQRAEQRPATATAEASHCRGDDFAVASCQQDTTTGDDEQPKRILQYSDGAWEEPEENAPLIPAGYGAVEFEEIAARPGPRTIASDARCEQEGYEMGQQGVNGTTDQRRARMTWAVAGIVETDPKGEDYIGATKHTNNTGELTAMHAMLRRAMGRRAGQSTEVLHSDSLYAINMTTGKWMPRKHANHVLIGSLRKMWRQLQRRRPHEVTMQHVRSHIGIPGNETADHLADLRWGMTQRGHTALAQAKRWLTRWFEQRSRPPGDG